MNWAMYFNNMFRMGNRIFNGLLAGGIEIPLSARAGYWYAEGIKDWPYRLINWVFDNELHCSHAYRAEDDNQLRRVPDPNGDMLEVLFAFWTIATCGLPLIVILLMVIRLRVLRA